jgi:hypothetical protein
MLLEWDEELRWGRKEGTGGGKLGGLKRNWLRIPTGVGIRSQQKVLVS